MSAAYNNEANEFFFQDKDEEVCIGIIPASEVSYFPRVGEIYLSLDMKEAMAVITSSHTSSIALSPNPLPTTSSFALGDSM